MGKRIENAIQQRRTQQNLENQAGVIRGREATTFTGSANNPFDAPKRDNYQTYPYDYFSGEDCKIFFGDIWVDDVITLQYSVTQSKTPIYGYASQLFDAVARGQILVEGTLSISFKETGYLNIIQSVLNTQKKNAVDVINQKLEEHKVMSEQGLAKFVPRLTTIGEDPAPQTYNYSFAPNGTPQIIRQSQTIEQILSSKKAGTALSDNLLGKGNDKNRDFEDFAEILEDTIWGDSNGEPLSLDNKLKRVDEFDYLENGGINSAKRRNYADVLNIMLTFGDINDFRAEHTIVVLNDVHFTSTGMIVSPNGDPLAETYNFFARDINDSISSEIKSNINPVKLNVGNDIKLSKLENVNVVENFLNSNPNQVFSIHMEAALDKYGWNSYQGEIELNFVPSRGFPFIDQLCLSVEKAMNDITVPEVVNVNKLQYIIKVEVGGFDTNDLTMILEQSVPNTRTYKVISPTRTGFQAPVFISRDDFFTDVSTMEKPMDIVKNRIDSNRKELNASISSALQEKNVIEEEISGLGLSDEQKAYENKKSKLESLQDKANRDGKISAWEEFRINNAQNRVDRSEIVLANELVKPLDQRTLNRQEQNRQVDLNNAYVNNSTLQENLSSEEQLLFNQEARYDTEILKQQEAKRKADAELARVQNEESVEEMRITSQQAEQTKIMNEVEQQIIPIDTELLDARQQLARIENEERVRTQYGFGASSTLNPDSEWVSDSTTGHFKDPKNLRDNIYGLDKESVVAEDIGTSSKTGVIRSPFTGIITYKGESSIHIKQPNGITVEYHEINPADYYVGMNIQTGDPVKMAINHVHIQTTEMSAQELESAIHLPYKPGVEPIVSKTQQEQINIVTQQRKIEAQKSKDALNFLHNNLTQNNQRIEPLIINPANITTNTIRKDSNIMYDMDTTQQQNTQPPRIIDQRVIVIPQELKDLYPQSKGPSYINLTIQDYISGKSQVAFNKDLSESFSLIKAQAERPATSTSDTMNITLALDRGSNMGSANEYDLAYELAHEYTHGNQNATMNDIQLWWDSKKPYDERPTEVQADKEAEENTTEFYNQYGDMFKSFLDEYNRNK